MKKLAIILTVFSGFGFFWCSAQQKNSKPVEVAVYYFPNYHVDSVNERWHGKGWTEWDLVKTATPRFPGHLQPKVPSWGYFDESNPQWAAREIELAAGHGIDVFIYDWYWYANTGPFLQQGLEQGFLKAANRSKLKFALMWANHNWANIHPTPYTNFQQKLTDGEVTPELWEKITDYIVSAYFSQPNYWKINGRPYFSIFDGGRFLHSFKSLAEAAQAMKSFNDKVIRAGFPGLYLNLIDQSITEGGLKNLPFAATRKDVLEALGVSSVTSYNFLYAFDLSHAGWPTASYQQAIEKNVSYWGEAAASFGAIPYFPNVTMGWDVTPRLVQSDKFDSFKGYPWTPVFNGDNTPKAFGEALSEAVRFLDAHPEQPRILTVNAWNEWTEGSYLLPDKRTGEGYLNAIRDLRR